MALKKEKKIKTVKKEKYFYALGRRKTAAAQVRLFEKGKKKSAKKVLASADKKSASVSKEDKVKKGKQREEAQILVNSKDYKKYFPTLANQFVVEQPLRVLNVIDEFRFEAKVWGSGSSAQAQAVRHGIAKALVLQDKKFKISLKSAEILKRDTRMVERKKAGFRKARRRRQWSKR